MMATTGQESATEFDTSATQNLVDSLVTEIRDAAKKNQASADTTEPPPAYHNPLLVDRRAQTTLAVRVGLYWIACVSYFAVVLFSSQIMYNPNIELTSHIQEYLLDMVQWLPATLLLLPLVIYDMLRVSQRIFTPVEEVRQGLQVLASGKVPDPIEACDEEFNQALIHTYNEIRESVIAETVAAAMENRLLDSAMDNPES